MVLEPLPRSSSPSPRAPGPRGPDFGSPDTSVELLLLLKFPREVFHLAPPVPITLDEGPQVAFEFGQIRFYFDRWDAPDPDLEDGPRPMADAFYTHLTLAARTLPEKLELALTVPAHPYASAVCSEPWEDNEPDDVARAEELCDRMFGDPALEDYSPGSGSMSSRPSSTSSRS